MRPTFSSFAAALVAAVSFAAAATTTTTDYSDIWYNAPAESQSGWGVNIAQQGEVIFATLFVYGQDNTPRWFVAPNVPLTSANTFSGQLLNVGTGTWFAAPWAGVSAIQGVGDITFTFASPTSGTLAYTVNGAQVTKNIVRQSWRSDLLSGTYVGAVTGFGPACGATGRVRIPGTLIVGHDATGPISMTLDFAVSATQTGRCTYSGNYAQVGVIGNIGGTYHCDVNGVVNAVTGNFTVDEIRTTRNGWLGRITVVSPQCNYAGYMGGVKDSF
jgi:hypothetical protein